MNTRTHRETAAKRKQILKIITNVIIKVTVPLRKEKTPHQIKVTNIKKTLKHPESAKRTEKEREDEWKEGVKK